ncbi:MAG TPA: hypothetical protein VIX82_15320 [Solirubrobacteraceae bacterium]
MNPRSIIRKRRRKSPNGAGRVYFNQTTERWIGRYTAEDPETGLAVREAVYGRTEQEARARQGRRLTGSFEERASSLFV